MRYGWRARIGAIQPENNTTMEPEMESYVPPGVSVQTARVVMKGEQSQYRERTSSGIAAMPVAIESLRGRVGVMCYACMTTSLWQPLGWHKPLLELTGGVPFLPAGETTVEALQHLGARRIGVFSPYFKESASLVPGWFEQFDIEVVHNINVPFTRYEVIGHSIEEFHSLILREFRDKKMDALAVLATDLSTLCGIDALETDLGVPVVSTTLALLWGMLRAVGVREGIPVGTLFRGGTR